MTSDILAKALDTFTSATLCQLAAELAVADHAAHSQAIATIEADHAIAIAEDARYKNDAARKAALALTLAADERLDDYRFQERQCKRAMLQAEAQYKIAYQSLVTLRAIFTASPI